MAASDRYIQVGVTGQGVLQAALGLLGAFIDWAKLEAPDAGVSLALDGVPALVVACWSLPPQVASAAGHLLTNRKIITDAAVISFACDTTMSERYQGPMCLRNLIRDLSSGYADPENPDWVYVYTFHLQESDPPRQLPLELHPLRPLRNLIHVHKQHSSGNLRRFAALTPSAVAANALARLMRQDTPRQSDLFLLRVVSTLDLKARGLGGAWLDPTEWEHAILAIVGWTELEHFHGQVHQRLSDEYARHLDDSSRYRTALCRWSQCFAMYRRATGHAVAALKHQPHQDDAHTKPATSRANSHTSAFSASAPPKYDNVPAPPTPTLPQHAHQASTSTGPDPTLLNVTSAFDHGDDDSRERKRYKKKEDKTKKEKEKGKEAKKEKEKLPHVPGTRRAAWAGFARRLFKRTSKGS